MNKSLKTRYGAIYLKLGEGDIAINLVEQIVGGFLVYICNTEPGKIGQSSETGRKNTQDIYDQLTANQGLFIKSTSAESLQVLIDVLNDYKNTMSPIKLTPGHA